MRGLERRGEGGKEGGRHLVGCPEGVRLGSVVG